MGQFKNALGYTPEEQLQQHRQVEAAYDAAVRKSEQKEEDRILANAFPSSESFWDNPRNPSVADVKRLNYKYAPYITPETWSYDKKSVTDDAYNGRSVANYPYDHQVYQAPQQSEMLNNETPYLEFDGRKLKWQEGNKTVRSFDAMSGKPGYQNSWGQKIPDRGPIPEGVWNVDYSTRQSYPRDKETWGKRGFSQWGQDFVRLKPAPYTNTFGRDQFTIHGGDKLGSAGCIDLARQNPDFTRYLDDYGNDIRLEVQYPNYSLRR